MKGRIKAVSEDEDEGHVLHIFQQHWSQILLLCMLHQALRPFSPVSVCLSVCAYVDFVHLQEIWTVTTLQHRTSAERESERERGGRA